MGRLLKIIIDENLFLIEVFSLLRMGVSWIDNDTGKGTALIVGLWKLESNVTLAYRKKLEWHEIQEA